MTPTLLLAHKCDVAFEWYHIDMQGKVMYTVYKMLEKCFKLKPGKVLIITEQLCGVVAYSTCSYAQMYSIE